VLEPGIRVELARRGYDHVPVVFVGDDAYPGFDLGRLAAALDLGDAKYATRAGTPELVARLSEVLDGWVRAARQIPDDRFALVGDDGSRGELRRLLHQTPHLETTMSARYSGVWDGSLHSGTEIPRDGTTAVRELVALRCRFETWASTLTADELDLPCVGYYGDVTLSRLLELGLGRYAFQLRRLYGVMRDPLGIEPVDPIDDARLDEVTSPSQMLG
jgi:hypothetical protein